MFGEKSGLAAQTRGTAFETWPRVMSLQMAPCVLVADDQPDVVAALRLLLRSKGFDADTAASVDEVRVRLASRPYDLLLMDLNYARDTTSGREGLDLLAEVHARDRGLPVIVMTGWGSIETAVEAMRLGARTFVHKPWDNESLTQTIRREVDDGIALRLADSSARREREDAQRIQRALLPAALPRLAGCDMAAEWRPASSFGGDCYDAIAIVPTQIAISIADVAGKGLPAALLMAHLQASIRAFSGEETSPARVTALANQSLCRNTGIGRFVTLFYGVLNTETRTLSYSNAGHNPPVLIRADGSVERLSAGGLLLGVYADAVYRQGDVAVQPGDRLVLFTDGITEAMDAHDVDFGDGRLIDVALRHRHRNAQELVDALFDAVSSFAGRVFADDATIVCVAL
jgi:serine phosphatase RsbU (regulator of sigma subunit)